MLGEEGTGFLQLVTNLPQERLSIAVTAVAAARAAFERTLEYAKERTAFGQPIGTFQNSRFALRRDGHGDRDRPDVRRPVRARPQRRRADAPRRRRWRSGGAPSCRAVSSTACVQLHGGYGYMTEYPIARAFADARITRIYGGTTEIMKEIIGRSLGL